MTDCPLIEESGSEGKVISEAEASYPCVGNNSDERKSKVALESEPMSSWFSRCPGCEVPGELGEESGVSEDPEGPATASLRS